MIEIATGEPTGATGERIGVRLTGEKIGASVGDLVPCWGRAERAVQGIGIATGIGGRATAAETGIATATAIGSGAAGSAKG